MSYFSQIARWLILLILFIFCSSTYAIIEGQDPMELGLLGLPYRNPFLQGQQHHLMIANRSYQTFFPKAEQVVTSNEATTGTTEQLGDSDPNHQHWSQWHLRWNKPLPELSSSFQVSFEAPFPEIIQLQTRSPYQLQYRYDQQNLTPTRASLQWAYYLPQHYFALTWHSTLSLEAQTDFIAGINSSETASSAQLSARLRVSGAFDFHYSYAFEDHYSALLHLIYQQAQNQRITNRVAGRAPLGSSSALALSFLMTSQYSFRPERWQAIGDLPWGGQRLLLSLTREDWSSYESSVIKLTQVEGILQASDAQAAATGTAIWIPALGLVTTLNTEHTSMLQRGLIALSYQPKALQSDSRGLSNLVDQEKWLLGLGLEGSLFERPQWHWQWGLQTHYLKRYSVVKSPNQEDGTAGSKIGSPGYDVGGWLLASSLGMTYSY